MLVAGGLVMFTLENTMKARWPRFAVVILISLGCIGDRALPIVSSTQIPEKELQIHLGGPDTEGNFGYYITTSSGSHLGHRTLGRLKPDQTKPVLLDRQGNDRFRIRWGSSQGAQFAIIDVKNEQFVEDSNPANPKNQSFVKQ